MKKRPLSQKILSIICSATLAFGLMPMPAFAAVSAGGGETQAPIVAQSVAEPMDAVTSLNVHAVDSFTVGELYLIGVAQSDGSYLIMKQDFTGEFVTVSNGVATGKDSQFDLTDYQFKFQNSNKLSNPGGSTFFYNSNYGTPVMSKNYSSAVSYTNGKLTCKDDWDYTYYFNGSASNKTFTLPYDSTNASTITLLEVGEGSSEGGETHTHSYTYVETTPATCTTAGVETGTCECGANTTRAIAALGHNYVNGACTRCGDSSVIIGEGTSTGYTAPYTNYYKNGGAQMIYKASEIGFGGDISSFAFYVGTASTLATTSVKVYMGHTDKNTFTASSDRLSAADLTLVYDGAPTLGAATGWENFDLDEPFSYNGTDNLVVAVYRHSTSYNGTLKYQYTTASSTVLYRQNDSTADYGDVSGTANYTVSANRPNIKLGFLASCAHESGLTFHEAVEPQCGNGNIAYYDCPDCSKYFADADATEQLASIKGEHAWNTGVVTTEPTCAVAGVRTFTCTACGETKTEAEPATGNHNLDLLAGTAPTCTETGTADCYKCSTCNGLFSDAAGTTAIQAVPVVAATGHNFTKLASVDCGHHQAVCANAGCTEVQPAGYTLTQAFSLVTGKNYVLVSNNYMMLADDATYSSARAVASYSASATIPSSAVWTYTSEGYLQNGTNYLAKGSYGQDLYAKASTADALIWSYTSAGKLEASNPTNTWNAQISISAYYGNCQMAYTGSAFTLYEATPVESTSEHEYVDGVCACGDLESDHQWASVVTEPTCLVGGYTTKTCAAHDNFSMQTDATEALGHNWGEYAVTAPATCTETGSKTAPCTRTGCEATDTQEIAALGHDFTKVVSNNCLTHKVVCAHEGCTEQMPAGVVLTEANAFEAGKQYVVVNSNKMMLADNYTATNSYYRKAADYTTGMDIPENAIWTYTSEGYLENGGKVLTKGTSSINLLMAEPSSDALQFTYTDGEIVASNPYGSTYKYVGCGGSYFNMKSSQFAPHIYEVSYSEPVSDHEYVDGVCACGDLESNHQWTSVVTEPTCLAGGYTTWTCAAHEFSYQTGATEALGHEYTKYVDNGDGTHSNVCVRCDEPAPSGVEYEAVTAPAKGDSFIIASNGIAMTVDTYATTERQRAGVDFDTDTMYTDGMIWTWTEEGYLKCGDQYLHGSSAEYCQQYLLIDSQSDLTGYVTTPIVWEYTDGGFACDIDGTTYYLRGQNIGYGKYFNRVVAATQLTLFKANDVAAVSDHEYVDGTCTACGAEQPHVHSLAKTDAVEATCTTTGHLAYWTCSGCEKAFSDEGATSEIADLTGWLKKNGAGYLRALGHNYVNGTCTNCGEEFTFAVWAGSTKLADLSSATISEASDTVSGLRKKGAVQPDFNGVALSSLVDTSDYCAATFICADGFVSQGSIPVGGLYLYISTTNGTANTAADQVSGGWMWGNDVVRIDLVEHTYVDGTCTACGAEDPDYVPVVVTMTDYDADFGTAVTFDASNVSGLGTARATAFIWEFSSDEGQTWTKLGVTTAPTTTVVASQTNADRKWRVTAKLSDGRRGASNPFSLTVREASVSMPDVVADFGEDVTFEASAVANIGDATVSAYIWEFSSDEGQTWTKLGATAAPTMTVKANWTNAGREWRVTAKLSDGRRVESNAFALTIRGVTFDVPDVTAPRGGTFTATVTDVENLGTARVSAYIWEFSSDEGQTWTKLGATTTPSMSVQANWTNAHRLWRVTLKVTNGLRLDREFTMTLE